MIRLGHLNEDSFHRFDTATNAYVRCTVQEWQTEMIRDGHYTDEVFVRTAAELLGRQIILYPVIPHQNDRHRVIISPSIQSIHEPFHIIYYEETNFVNPHYQSIRPRQTPIIAAAPNNGNRGHSPSQQSLLSRLSAMNSTNHDQGMWILTLVID